MNRRFDDEQIDSFLKKNQPVAPAIDERKVHASLLAKLGFAPAEPLRRSRTTWFVSSGLAAAGIAAFFVLSKPLVAPAPTPVVASAPSESSDWDAELFDDEELPSLEVGEDYIELMAQNDVSGRVTK